MAKIIIDSNGEKHLPGSRFCMFVTACGKVDCFDGDATETEGTPDCAGCIDTAKTIFESITKKELKSCY